MTAQHTPGPWQIVGEADLPDVDDLMIVAFDIGPSSEGSDLFICNLGSNGGEFSVCAPVDAGDKWPVSLANARLIAAAPELLEAVKEALRDLVYLQMSGAVSAKMCVAAIDKAEGRS